MDTTTAAHECITGLLGLLDEARRCPAGANRPRLADELSALADAAETAGCAPETDATLGADARELAALAHDAADALAPASYSRRALAA